MRNKWLIALVLAAMVVMFSLTMVFAGCGEIEPMDEPLEDPFDEPIQDDMGY